MQYLYQDKWVNAIMAEAHILIVWRLGSLVSLTLVLLSYEMFHKPVSNTLAHTY